MTRIAYVSDFSEPWYTPSQIARDAEAIGCTVERLNERGDFSTLETAIRETNPSLCLYTKHHGLPPEAVKMWRSLEESGIRTASHHLDLYVGLPRQAEVGIDPFWTTGTVFTPDFDPGTQSFMWAHGVNHHPIAPACVSDEAIRVDPSMYPEAFHPAEIVFVGSTRSYHPRWKWRMTMLDALRARYGERFATFGPHDGASLRGLPLNAVLQTPGRVVVGDSLMLPDHYGYSSDRLWESLGRGGALIYPRVPGLDAFGFHEHEHLRYYTPGDLEGLFAGIDSMLAAPDESRAMADRGQSHVGLYGTYRHRVAEMLSALELS